jgi:hypothetical protein
MTEPEDREHGRFWVHRQIISSEVFCDPDLLKVWIWCLARASWKPRTWEPAKTGRGSTAVYLKPGQFVFGRKAAGKELDMPAATVELRMKRLKNMGNLDMQPGSHFTLVTVQNWQIYQRRPRKPDKQLTGNWQATDRQLAQTVTVNEGKEGEVKQPSSAAPPGGKKPPPDPRHHDLVVFWCNKWQESYRVKYPFNARDAAHVKQLLAAAGDLPKAQAVVERFLACDDKWLTERRHGLKYLTGDLPRFLSESSGRAKPGELPYARDAEPLPRIPI